VLNVIDSLAGDTRFLSLRSRRPQRNLLRVVDSRTAIPRQQAADAEAQANAEALAARRAAAERQRKIAEEWNRKITALGNDPAAKRRAENQKQEQLVEERRRTEAELARIERERRVMSRLIKRDLQIEIRSVQNDFKFWALVLPPLPPLAVGLLVLLSRLRREQEGVSRTRLKTK